MSRATIYRQFPGGRDQLIDQAFRAELARLTEEICASAWKADSLETALASLLCDAGTAILNHAVVQYLVRYEPEVLAARLSFDRFDETLSLVRRIFAPVLHRFTGEQASEELIEWVARMTISLTFSPGLADITKLDEVRQLVRAFALPGLQYSQQPSQIQGASV